MIDEFCTNSAENIDIDLADIDFSKHSRASGALGAEYIKAFLNIASTSPFLMPSGRDIILNLSNNTFYKRRIDIKFEYDLESVSIRIPFIDVIRMEIEDDGMSADDKEEYLDSIIAELLSMKKGIAKP